MTPQALYDLLAMAGVDYDVVETFEGIRILVVEVEEPEDEENAA